MYDTFGLPLKDMTFVATKEVWRISTNGKYIFFEPDWLTKLLPAEIDFILCHQLMHIALGHINRPDYYKGDRYHLAADIVANAKLANIGWEYDKIGHIGKIRTYTFYPMVFAGTLSSYDAINYVPVDSSIMEPAKRRQFMIDSEDFWQFDGEFPADATVVLSPEDEDPDMFYTGPTYGKTPHYISEYILNPSGGGGESAGSRQENRLRSDAKSTSELKDALRDLRESIDKSQKVEDNSNDRYWTKAKIQTKDWRKILDSFVQEEVFDYSFTPPDKRLQDLDFFLPEYNAYQNEYRKVFFMVDTSGSITDEVLSLAYSEICQVIEQFGDSLTGMVAFFDTKIYRPTPFQHVSDIRSLRPTGGGGTEYRCIFDYIQRYYQGTKPTSIVVITDGKGAFPDERVTDGVPVLWLVVGDEVAPWGRTLYIS